MKTLGKFENLLAPVGSLFPEATTGELFILEGHATLNSGLYVYLKNAWHEVAVGIENPSGHPYIWKDLFAPLDRAKPVGASSPTWEQMDVVNDSPYAYAYTYNQDQSLQITFHINHDYAKGTVFYPHVHWLPSDMTTGTVRWILKCWYAKGHQRQAFDWSNPTTVIIEQAAFGQTWMHQVGEIDLTTLTSQLEPDGLLIVNVTREGTHVNDTYSGKAYGLQCDIHYVADRVGTINKAPNFYGPGS